MSTGQNVFISWSGERSLEVARALRAWLPKVLQIAKPWMSDTEIEKGSRGINEVARALEGIKVGISCLTPENLEAPWLVFEAGALSKSIDDKTRLCTYLFGGLNFQDVKAPLSMFQATKADKDDTRKLVHAINRALQEAPIPEPDLDELFDAMWPRLETNLRGIPVPEQIVEVKRSTEDMVAEILDWARGEPQRRTDLTLDITNRVAAIKLASRPTVDLTMNVNGKPLTVAVAGLPEILKPVLMKVFRKKSEETVDRAVVNVSSALEKAIGESATPEVQDALTQAKERIAIMMATRLADGLEEHFAEKYQVNVNTEEFEAERSEKGGPAADAAGHRGKDHEP